MTTVIVLNELRDAINEKIDKALVEAPQFAEQRESIFSDLLNYYDQHGVVPDFSLAPKEQSK
jgi:hypothetical protein